ncbi:MAG: hypothetical protein ACRDMU_02880 [Gaiellaceae bacterium]
MTKRKAIPERLYTEGDLEQASERGHEDGWNQATDFLDRHGEGFSEQEFEEAYTEGFNEGWSERLQSPSEEAGE